MGNHIVDKILHQNLSDFYRPNYFKVVIERSSGEGKDSKDKVLVEDLIQTVSIPSVTIGAIPIKRMGKTINIPGNVEYSDITMTIYDDADGTTRGYFHEWQEEYYGKDIDIGLFENIYSFTTGSSVEIQQLDRSFKVIGTTILHYAFPSSIGELELSHESTDAVAMFTVAFNYSFREYKRG